MVKAKVQATSQPIAEAVDHRVEVAARKRQQMHERLLYATMQAVAVARPNTPVIEDVVRLAGVSRGTFYLHFSSLEEATQALAIMLSDQLTRESLPFYDVLKEPWQRFATGFRGFLLRASGDASWASYVTGTSAIAKKLLARDYMTEDLRLGRESGQFKFADIEVAVDFMLGASTAGIATLGSGVANAEAYIDESVRMALVALGCSPALAQRGVKFSREYLVGWKVAEGSERAPV